MSAKLDYESALEFDPRSDNGVGRVVLSLRPGTGRRAEQGTRRCFSRAKRRSSATAIRASTSGVALMDEDIEEARRWLLQAAEDGYQPAYEHLARSFRRTVADEPDPEEAKRWYETAAEEGSVAASLAIAYMYRDGELGDPDSKEAARRFSISRRWRFRGCQGGAGAPVSFRRRGGPGCRPRIRAIQGCGGTGGHERIHGAGLPSRDRDRHRSGPRYRQDPGTAAPPTRTIPSPQYRLGSLIFQPAQEDKIATALYWF